MKAFQQYVLWISTPTTYRILQNTEGIPLHTYVGMAGMPGQTAHHGWYEFMAEKAEKDVSQTFLLLLPSSEQSSPLQSSASHSLTHSQAKTLYISTAAGPVGSMLVQLARLTNPTLKIIGSTGSDEKVDFLGEIGVDVAFNYKKESVKSVLEREGPIDL